MKIAVTTEVVEQRIFLIRGHKVMIDRDLAELYGVETKYLNRQVKRNIERFPRWVKFREVASALGNFTLATRQVRI